MIKLIVFVILSLIVFTSGFNYQEIQYENNACTGNFVFRIKTAKCSPHGFVKKVNDSVVMIIPIKSSAECVDSNDGSPKPSPTPSINPSPTPSNNNTNNTDSSSSISSGSHHNSSLETSSSSSSLNNNTNSTTSSDSLHHNDTSSSSSMNTTMEPYTPPTFYKINECNVLPDGTSLFVTIQEEDDEFPYKEVGFCNDIKLLDINCDYPQVRTYNNFTCIPLGKNEKGVAQFERISCRGNLQSIDYDFCLHDCQNVNCNFNRTEASGVILCPDIRTEDTTNNGANNLTSIFNNNFILLLSFCIYFIFYF